MDGSDDYFADDDIVFDETTLAALDLEEKKWQQQQQTQTAQRRPLSQDSNTVHPQPKKQKTAHNATPGGLTSRAHPASAVEDYDEDLPDILIEGNGTYGLPGLPAAQHATAKEIAAHIRVSSVFTNGARTSTSPPVHQPTPATRANTVQAPLGNRSRDASPSLAPGPSKSQSTSTVTRNPVRNKPSRQSTLSSIQAALAGYVPPASKPAPTPAPSYNYRPSRASPAPAPARSVTPQAPPGRNPNNHPLSSGRPPPRGRSPSVVDGANRRQSFSASISTFQRRPSPQKPPLPLPNVLNQPPSTQGQAERHLVIEVETVKAQLEELKKAQEKVAAQLEEAQNARFAKEGEVSILRKTIEKASKDHAAEVARIKAAKEAAEALIAQTRKEAHDELERVKTEYAFKQHDLETSRTKTPWRVKRADTSVPVTPQSGSSQRRQSAASTQNEAGLRTPSRARNAVDLIVSPQRPQTKKIVHIPEIPPKKSPKLLGFVNGFESSTPKNSVRFSQTPDASQRVRETRKGKERAEQAWDLSASQAEETFFNPPDTPGAQTSARAYSPFLQQLKAGKSADLPDPDSQPKSSPPRGGVVLERSSSDEAIGDADMDVDDPSEEEELLGDPLLDAGWSSRELQRIVLSHKYGSEKRPTLQLLINHPLSPSASSESVQEYTTHSAKILELLAMKVMDTNRVIIDVNKTLCTLADALCNTESMALLAALLNMLKILSLFVPSFVTTILSPTEERNSADAPPSILLLICNVIKGLLDPTAGSMTDNRAALAREALGLLEAISWHIRPDLVMRLTFVLRTPDVLNILVNAQQPVWFLQSVLRTLSLIASYPELLKHFLVFEVPDEPEKAEKKDKKQACQIRHIEILAIMLVNETVDATNVEGRRLQFAILRFFGTLLIVHNDETCRTILFESYNFLPAIVHLLMRITTPIFEEDDEDFWKSSELVDWTMDVIRYILILLYHLLKGREIYTIRYKLVSTGGIYNGVWDMFTVALGRVSYCEPPLNISASNQAKLDDICDTAKEVLEWTVDGPEQVLIWEAFQTDDEAQRQKSQKVDDEDSEMQMEYIEDD